ncbi:MAG: DUF2812 domain-containing protein [Clostridiales bacterium]|nr:DUF2812 domain-containing protein [Clostridiales bacterium]
MRQVIRKLFWAWDFDKEEKWLNEMAAQGKALVSARYITYEFEESQPGEYAVRLEMLENSPASEEGRQYIEFVESTGAEYVGKVMKWVYFRKKKELGEFELHGDNATRLKHLKSIMMLLLPLGVMNVFIGLYNLCIGIGLNSGINVLCSLCSFAVTVLLVFGLKRLNDKKKKLEKESQLFE